MKKGRAHYYSLCSPNYLEMIFFNLISILHYLQDVGKEIDDLLFKWNGILDTLTDQFVAFDTILRSIEEKEEEKAKK